MRKPVTTIHLRSAVAALLTSGAMITERLSTKFGDTSFPLASNLKGYVQYFTGYGYPLIDYNVSQRVLGAGVQVDF